MAQHSKKEGAETAKCFCPLFFPFNQDIEEESQYFGSLLKEISDFNGTSCF